MNKNRLLRQKQRSQAAMAKIRTDAAAYQRRGSRVDWCPDTVIAAPDITPEAPPPIVVAEPAQRPDPPIPLRMPAPLSPPPRPSHDVQRSPWQKEIEHLEDEVRRLRMTVLRTAVPDEHLMLFQDYRSCKTRDEYWAWQRKIHEVVMDMGRQQAQDVWDGYSAFVTRRTDCPLCREGNTVGGWAVPGGLEQHLLGTMRNEQCDVLRVVKEIAVDYLHERFAAADAAAQRAMAERRHTETVYMIGLDEPVLLKDRHSWRAVRDERSMAFAEQRLAELGFTRYQERNVVSYQQVHDSYVIIADPRSDGVIVFCVCSLQQKGRRQNWTALGSFELHDHLKNDLSGKFDAEFAEYLTR